MSSELKYGCNNLGKSDLLYLIIGIIVTAAFGILIYNAYVDNTKPTSTMTYILYGVGTLCGLVLLVWSAMCLYNPEKKSTGGFRMSNNRN